MAPNPNNSMIFVNYQVEGTLGRRIRDGAREIAFVNEQGKVEIVKVKMEVYAIEGFSGHSDRTQLLDYIKHIQPKPSKIILVHGEKKAITSLAREIEKRGKSLGIEEAVVLVPNILDSYTLAYNM
jgi:hypothetical protein